MIGKTEKFSGPQNSYRCRTFHIHTFNLTSDRLLSLSSTGVLDPEVLLFEEAFCWMFVDKVV